MVVDVVVVVDGRKRERSKLVVIERKVERWCEGDVSNEKVAPLITVQLELRSSELL
jgi:hypothetical protein